MYVVCRFFRGQRAHGRNEERPADLEEVFTSKSMKAGESCPPRAETEIVEKLLSGGVACGRCVLNEKPLDGDQNSYLNVLVSEQLLDRVKRVDVCHALYFEALQLDFRSPNAVINMDREDLKFV